MKNDVTLGLVILLAIVAIGIFGGSKNSQKAGDVQIGQISDNQTTDSRKIDQVQTIGIPKPMPEVKISYVNHFGTASQEYVSLEVHDQSTTTKINITGWTIKSLPSGTTVTIPKGAELYFTESQNVSSDVYVRSGDVVYILTGHSPINFGFKTNKCSGYTAQFQNFTPNVGLNCPAPRNEDQSSIPKINSNDECLDYIESMPICMIPTQNLPVSFTYECKRFIETKVGYNQCINLHKEDNDFYRPEWHLYLNRNTTLWKTKREDIVLIDNTGKIVSEIKY